MRMSMIGVNHRRSVRRIANPIPSGENESYLKHTWYHLFFWPLLFATWYLRSPAGDNLGVGTAGSVLTAGGCSNQGGVSEVTRPSVEAAVALARHTSVVLFKYGTLVREVKFVRFWIIDLFPRPLPFGSNAA